MPHLRIDFSEQVAYANATLRRDATIAATRLSLPSFRDNLTAKSILRSGGCSTWPPEIHLSRDIFSRWPAAPGIWLSLFRHIDTEKN